jgi:two-component system, NtrC family, sensor histidine kinase KinB
VTLKRIETDRYIRDLDFLLDVTRETLSSLQLNPLLRRVVWLMRDRFGYDSAAVALVEDEMVVFRAGSGGDLDPVFQEGGQVVWRVPVGMGIVGNAVKSIKPRLVNDVTLEPDYIVVEYLAQTRSELTVPLVHRDKVLGVLDVQSHRVAAFDETDVRLLEIVGALVAPAVHIAGLYERERTRSRHLHLVGEISRLVMSSLDRENVISVACEAILEALDISFAGIALLDKSGLRVIHGGHAARSPLSPDKEFSFALGEGVVGEVIASGESARIGDLAALPAQHRLVAGMKSELCVPLRVREKIVGAVDVEHSEPYHFTEEDEGLLENMAAYLAQAMENAQLFDNQRRRWQELLVINEAARIATESFDLDDILEQVAREVHDRFGYFAVAVMLSDDRDVVIRALKCDEALDLKVGHRIKLGSGVAGRVAQSGEVRQTDNPGQLEPSDALRSDIQSILCVPLRAQTGVIGVIQVQSLEPEVFGSDDRLVMETLAQSVAGAIANARSIQHAEQLREDLNRMIVHDLRNPVQAVLLTLQEVQRAAEGTLPENVTESVKEGISCTEDILEMVNSLLDVSRFEAGKATLRLAPAALNDHIRAVVRRFAPLARSKGIQVTTVLSQEVPVVRIDHELISRTLANLIGNAVKFTPEGGKVTIRSELCTEARPAAGLPAPFVLVSVQDAGEGIPLEYHAKIFEKFGQVESRKAGLKMSSGLGLALCRYVVEGHGGAIWVDSEVGRGSTFYFSLRVPVRDRPRV